MSSGAKERLTLRLRNAQTRYRPVSRIAAGGMAEVWRGEAQLGPEEAVPIAIKRVLPHLGDSTFLTMFEDEARLGMLLHHPNIVRVYDARNIGGTYIIIMELVDGDTLKGLLDATAGRLMPVPLALHIARELLRGLGHAHSATDETGASLGIIHRDVSPHNLLLGRDGGVKLSDFGLADATTNAAKKEEGMVGGKFGYLAPEVVLQKPIDHRLDLFAAGIVLWEMLAGRRLFQGSDDRDTIRKVAKADVPRLSVDNPAIPEQIDDFLMGLLHVDPAQRYGSGREAADALEVLIDWLEPNVSADDVGLVMSVHGHQRAERKQLEHKPLDVFDMLAQELEAFAEQAAGGTGGGSAPLDPSLFGRGFGRVR